MVVLVHCLIQVQQVVTLVLSPPYQVIALTVPPSRLNNETKQVAALLTNRVPAIQGGAEVLELSAKDTKTLYYMPTGGVRRLTLSAVKDLENVRFCCSTGRRS